jgi:hypothetical protein
VTFTPRFNHVAISVDPAVMDDEGRRAILAFYGAVFGWTEGDNSTEKGNPLILYTGTFAQFVYLLPGDPYLECPSLDHFGFELSTTDELEQVVERAKEYKLTDDRVSIIDVERRTTHGPTHDYTLTSAYIGFMLPMMVELQHIERTERS